MELYDLKQVFGTQRNLLLNYVSRTNVDDLLNECIYRKQHVVIFGGSKQGKTCLRKKNLSNDQYILINCQAESTIQSINQQILKLAGFEVTVSKNKTVKGEAKVIASTSLPFLIKGTGEMGGFIESNVTKEPLDIDLSNVNDIQNALNSVGFKKIIVLDDFHYLSFTVQRAFAYQLKVFFDESDIIFIVVGVWLEHNRLTRLNGDLANRVISIDADIWEPESLLTVIKKGEKLLNLEFSDELRDEICEASFDCVHVIQDVCFRICKKLEIYKTVQTQYYISQKMIDVSSIVKDIVQEHDARYLDLVCKLSDCEGQTNNLYKWIILTIIKEDPGELSNGIPLKNIQRTLSNVPDFQISFSQLINLLKDIVLFQSNNNITPNILDFNQAKNEICVVDKGFAIWLYYYDKKQLEEMILN